MRSFLVAILLLAPAALAHAGRRVDIDPARLGTPMESPPIEVRIEGEPSAVGIPCDGVATASSTHDPVLEWRLTAATPSLRVTISGAHAAVHDFDGTWWCSDGHGELTIANARAGDYKLYVFADANKATVTLRLESPTHIEQFVDAARDAAPKIHIGASSEPNPVLRPLTASRAGQARDLHLCGGDRTTFTPLARLVVDDDVAQLHVAERGIHAAVELVDAGGHCVAPGPIKAGTYALWAAIDIEHVPAAFWIELDDASRPITWPDAPVVDLANLTEPLVDDGKIEKPTPLPTRAATACKALSGTPSFYIFAGGSAASVDLRMVWSRRAQWFLVEGPGVSRCSADGGSIGFTASGERYAVWAGGDVGADFMFLIHRVGATISPLTTYAHPPADLSLAERALPHFYPFFELGPDDASARAAASALFAVASDRLLVFAADGQPLLVLAVDHGAVDVLTTDGRKVRVSAKALTIVTPKSIALPDGADTAVQQRFAGGGTTSLAVAQPLSAETAVDLPEPVPPTTAPTTPAATATPADVAAEVHAPAPVWHRHAALTVAFPIGSRVQLAPGNASGQGLDLRATMLWDLGPRLRIGAAIEDERWRNELTSTVGEMSHVVGAVAIAQYDLVQLDAFQLIAHVGAGAGLSVMAPDYVFYDPGTVDGMHQHTAVDSRYGLGVDAELGAGARRVLANRLAMVGAIGVRGTETFQHMVFTSSSGATVTTDDERFVAFDVRIGLELGF